MLSNPFSRRTPSSGADGDRQQQQILLGWNASDSPQPFGIRPGTAASPRGANPVTYDGDAPVLTVASTGSGKGRGVLIPNLLRLPRPRDRGGHQGRAVSSGGSPKTRNGTAGEGA